MRRVIGFTLISLAAFALALGLMLRFYAYPNLARADLGGYTQSIAEGSGLTVFDPDAIKNPDVPAERHNVNLVATRTVKGITIAPEAKPRGDVMVWEVGTVVMDRDNPDPEKPISVTQDRLCLDRRTNEAVHPCRNEYFKDPGRAEENQEFRGEHKGQNYKFPFDTQPRDHRYFDTTLRRALPIQYVGEESVGGLLTYKFEQKVPRVKIEEREVPGHLLDSPADSVDADRYYANHRTLWVEPLTGIVVKGTETTRQTLEDPDGPGVLTLLEGTMSLSKKSVAENIAKATKANAQLQTLTWRGPLLLTILGAALGVAGALLLWLRRRDEDDHDVAAWERQPELAR